LRHSGVLSDQGPRLTLTSIRLPRRQPARATLANDPSRPYHLGWQLTCGHRRLQPRPVLSRRA
jgi:hypothetical protein